MSNYDEERVQLFWKDVWSLCFEDIYNAMTIDQQTKIDDMNNEEMLKFIEDKKGDWNETLEYGLSPSWRNAIGRIVKELEIPNEQC